jgi:hypothetical protein
MNENPLDRIPEYDRLSLRAVIVPEGQDPGPYLASAGIDDPVALPIVFGDAEPSVTFGEAFTPNLKAVLESDQPDSAGFGETANAASGSGDNGSENQAKPWRSAVSQAPGLEARPSVQGYRSVAPILRRQG